MTGQLHALKAAIDELGTPTEGPAAVALWEWLSGNRGPAWSMAAEIYRQLGYEPFEGYPLTRSSDFRIEKRDHLFHRAEPASGPAAV